MAAPALPAPRPQRGVVTVQAPDHRENQRERVVGDGALVLPGRRDHRDAELRRGGDVDGVEADAGAGEHPQAIEALERRSIDDVGAEDGRDRSVQHARHLARRSLDEPWRVPHRETRLLQPPRPGARKVHAGHRHDDEVRGRRRAHPSSATFRRACSISIEPSEPQPTTVKPRSR